MSAVKTDKDYLIGSEVIIEIDCLPILEIKSLNPEIRHIGGKENAMADMLSRARFKNESDMVSEDEDVTLDFFKKARLSADDKDMQTLHAFNEDGYEESGY